MSSDDDLFGLVFAFGGSLYFFFKGFRVFRKYRVLADTPVVPIRSVAMGLVEVHGKAKGEEPIYSPVTNTPCFHYKVDIERWETDSKGRGSWSRVRTDNDGVKFYLEDASGNVLVDLYDVEFDLKQNARREIGGQVAKGWIWKAFSREKTPPASPSTDGWPTDFELMDYVSSGGLSRLDASRVRLSKDEPIRVRPGKGMPYGESVVNSLKQVFLRRSFGGGGGSTTNRYRLTEYCIIPGYWYDLTGTCVENPGPRDLGDRNMIAKGEDEPTFLISWRSEEALESSLRRKALLFIFLGAVASVFFLGILLNELGWL
jgi:hypothetical protein